LKGFHCKGFEYIFLPGRLHPWKRVDLVIKAMGYMNDQIKLLITGTGEAEQYLKDLAKDDERILFLGRVSDRELIALYADALVVPFVPIREDFGLVTLEAFLSSKPVITCDDSGEPVHIVRDGETGFICSPSPEEIASRLDYLYQDPDVARRMGEQGRASVEQITWQNVAEDLIRSLGL
jgi:glycosyltransferase involved in cell wall biosynthesis